MRRGRILLWFGLACYRPNLLYAAGGPVATPIIYQSLQPASVAPGGPDFTLTVLGNGFHYESTIYWNNQPLATKVITTRFVSAVVPAALTATAQTASIRVHNPHPFSGFSNTVFFPVTRGGTAEFSAAQYALPAPTNSATVADYNQDGNLDIAFTQPNSNNSGILFGRGDGTFGKPQVSVRTCPNQTTLGSLVSDDFNRDGIPDLAVGCGNQVTVNLGVGDGTFHSHRDYLQSARVISLQIADVDGDGKLDLVFSMGYPSTGEIGVLLGNGDGTFQEPTHVFPAPGASSLAIGDFNRDGKLDLAVDGTVSSADTTGQLSIFLGTGDGSFTAPSTTYPIGYQFGIIAVDIDGDGALDIMALNGEGFCYYRGGGDGTLNKPSCSPPLSQQFVPTGLALGDFNGDGKLDVAISGLLSGRDPSPILLYLGNGNGQFNQEFSTGNNVIDGALVMGDFNNDGKLDLAAGQLYFGNLTTLIQR